MSDGVRIDTGRVGEFGRGLRTEADSGFADAAGRGARLHGHGVEFGRGLKPSDVVGEAQQRYATALASVEANLRAHQAAAGVLADAAEKIAQSFAGADMSSDEALRKVQTVIDAAVRSANALLVGEAVM